MWTTRRYFHPIQHYLCPSDPLTTLQFVNPFMGSEGAIAGYAYGGGDIFVGGAVPFGMVKLGIDTYEEPVNQSALNGGWTPQGKVTGISLLHESGTGGGPKYGYPAQMPLANLEGVNLLDNLTYWQTRVSSFCRHYHT
jgi:putative alpha-1,2-mannosidase